LKPSRYTNEAKNIVGPPGAEEHNPQYTTLLQDCFCATYIPGGIVLHPSKIMCKTTPQTTQHPNQGA